MTQTEYYERLKERYAEVNWHDCESVRQYNEYRQKLRKELEEEDAT